MVRLDRSMMERYEIVDRRPKTLRAALFGLDPLMLCVAARLLDCANEKGGDLGAVCVTGSNEAEQLRAQDGMFTLLVRGEREDGSPIREERVVQSILEISGLEGAVKYAAQPELDIYMLPAVLDPEAYVEQASVLKIFLHARWEAKLSAPHVLLLDREPAANSTSLLHSCATEIAALSENNEFIDWLKDVSLQTVLVDSLFGVPGDADFAKAQREMNYQDRFLLWAEPQLKCTAETALPEGLTAVCKQDDFTLSCEKKNRIFDSIAFLCAAMGFLSGMDTFSEVLRDEVLRGFIGHAFFDEILPSLPWPKEKITPDIISAFARLENPMNEASLLDCPIFRSFALSLLPSIRAYADQEFEAPSRLTLSFAAAIMLYAGARKNDDGEYEVFRGEKKFCLHDSLDVLDVFSRFSHDMPSESLTYAVLADRDLWGEDLREIPGLELRLNLDLASIQRVGFRETLRLCEG